MTDREKYIKAHALLVPQAQLLHLFYHRNKNQHRVAKWWVELGILRRGVRRLVGELAVVSGRFGARESEEERVRGRVRELEGRIIRSAFLAFSQVVKDNQYSALGLMLLGTLARIQKALQVLSDRREDEELWEEESMMVVVDVGDENKVDGKEEMEGVDFGEKILREEVVTHGGEEGDGEAVEVQKLSKGKEKRKSELAGAEVGKNGGESTPTKKPKKKKRKKGGDVFDDLFDSLM